MPELLPVEGNVTLAGQPIQEGSVSFRADGDGADPRYSPTGGIEQSGRYKLFVHGRAGCPAGKYRVVIFANEPFKRSKGGNAGLPKTIIDRKYNDPATTPLRVEVRPAASPTEYDLRIEK